MSPVSKAVAATLLAFFSFSAFGAPVFTCYSGKVSSKSLNFDEVRLGFSDDSSIAYTVIFAKGARKAGTDMACSKGIVGVCGLTDASGRLKVSEFNDQQIVFTFDGLPSIEKRPDSDWPYVDGNKPEPGLGPITLKRVKNLSLCEI